jgi:predicted Zn-ribbon and HTH transcriptional regulator
VTFRRSLIDVLSAQPRSVSSIARELGLKRGDVEDDLRHAIRSARAAGRRVLVEPARCRSCGFTFGEEKLSKPGKCPSCKGTWLFEPQIRVAPLEATEGTE